MTSYAGGITVVGFDRTLWMVMLLSSPLRPGVITTGLALAARADEEGLAVAELAQLARISRCNPSTVYSRKIVLLTHGFIERRGKVFVPSGTGRGGGVVCRYQLVIPDGGEPA